MLFHTAVCVCWSDGEEMTSVATEVGFRALTSSAIEHYLEREPALDCAGSFKSEGLGIALFDYCRSDDPTALVGLPLIATTDLLRRAGVDVL